MLMEPILFRVAWACAFLMLLGPVADRTMWLNRRGSTAATDAGIYNLAALLSGIVALAALALVVWTRPRIVPMLLGVAGVVVAFGLTVWVSGVAVLARWHGEVWVYAGWAYAGDPGRKQTIDPADGPYFFFITALAGAMAAVALAVIWLRQRGERRPHAGRPTPSASSAVGL